MFVGVFMLSKCAIYMTNKLKNYINISDNEKDVYIYGFELLLSNLSTMLIILSISILLGNILYTLSFVWFFFVPRLFCGGLHANTHLKCALMSNVIFVSTVIISKFSINLDLRFFIIVLLVPSLIITSVLSPIVNKNHPISNKTHKRNKIISISLSLINFTIIILTLYIITSNEIAVCSMLSFIWVAILMLIENLKQRRNQNGVN